MSAPTLKVGLDISVHDKEVVNFNTEEFIDASTIGYTRNYKNHYVITNVFIDR